MWPITLVIKLWLLISYKDHNYTKKLFTYKDHI